jgi:hypothetical protein|nr:MAG TPA: hypothetical protein [Crassvirales sp.]
MDLRLDYGSGAAADHSVYNVLRDNISAGNKLPLVIPNVEGPQTLQFAYVNTNSTIKLKLIKGAFDTSLEGANTMTITLPNSNIGGNGDTITTDSLNSADPLATYIPVETNIYNRTEDKVTLESLSLSIPSASNGKYNYTGSSVKVTLGNTGGSGSRSQSTISLAASTLVFNSDNSYSNSVHLNSVNLANLVSGLLLETSSLPLEEEKMGTVEVTIYLTRATVGPPTIKLGFDTNYDDSKLTVNGIAMNGKNGIVSIPDIK